MRRIVPTPPSSATIAPGDEATESNDEITVTFDFLKWRDDRGLSQQEASEKAGVSRRVWQLAEERRHKKRPRGSNAVKLAAIAGKPVSEIWKPRAAA